MEGSLYTDFNESLVTIHHNPYIVSNKEKCQLSGDQLRWTPCPRDNGKGALSVTTASGLTVINTHVPSDSQAAWSLLNNIAWPENNNAFVFVGDMNCRSEALMKMINDITKGKPSSGFLFPITTNKPSRTAMNQNGSRRYVWIDHYVISACLKQSVISPAIVYNEIGDISDHYPISLSFKSL
jgi:endonuclease/exonuclease/phosphatase family metal-dependent hydrolase